ncbi:MAG: LacI family DNA-binding transcriptional regulator [Candidatus Nanopelagicaceae bacterium]|nr:LacI family DNA-binding transcriptional regulator [Candidatus Nanopelagicaceae bacterium]
MGKRATLSQVAAYAGVSIATASRFFSNPELVKPETVDRIRVAAAALNYKAPRVLERDLSMLRIAVFARLFNHDGEFERLRGISNALRAWPHEMLLYEVDDSSYSMEYVKKLVVTKRVEGLIFIGAPIFEEVVTYIERFRVPTVLIENDDPRFSRVLTSDKKGSELVADFFNKSAATRILFVGTHPTSMNVSAGIRLKSFRDRLNRNKKDIVAELLLDSDSPDLQKEILTILKSKNRPEAIFAASDDLAVTVYTACISHGLKIGQDIALIGYGDTDIAAKLGISSVRTHLDATGRRAVEVLRSMDPDGEPLREELKVELIHRKSTL